MKRALLITLTLAGGLIAARAAAEPAAGPYAAVPIDRWSYAAVRKTERFKKFAGKAGLVEYWRAKGWPALCHPAGATDFACV